MKINDKTKAELQEEVDSLKVELEGKEKLQAEVEALKAQFEAKPVLEVKPATKKEPNDYLEERVRVQLFKDSGDYKFDLPVAVNGETIIIKRGIPVMVKRKHALVLKSLYRQQLVISELENKLADEYKEAVANKAL